MKTKTFIPTILVIFLSACVPIVVPAAPTSKSALALPDLVVSSINVAMVDSSGRCVDGYQVFISILNQGAAPANNVTAIELSTGHTFTIGRLESSQKMDIQIPAVPSNGTYLVNVDPQNLVAEGNETNNNLSFLFPTPTPNAGCLNTSTIDATPTPIPASPATPSPVSLEGLIYANLQTATIIRVFPGNHPVDLHHGTDAAFSPYGRFAVFEAGGDLLLAESMDNPGINLTNTPDLIEQFPQWWVSNPPKVVFSSISVDEMQQRVNTSSPTITGRLTLVNADGTDYAILSETPSYTMPALSPDGKTIAFEASGSPRLYEIGKGILPFDPNQYGRPFGPFENEYYFSPSFSPDGRQLTWWVRQYEPASNNFALAMFDLVGMTSRTLYSYAALGGTLGWLPNPVWSPSGQWIAFQTRDETTPNNLWIMHQGGGIGQRLGLATNPVWSPDSQQLVFIQESPRTANQPSVISIVDVPSWVVEQTSLPAGSIPLAWVTSLQSGAIQPFPTYDTPDAWGTYINPYHPYSVRHPPDAQLDAYAESVTIHIPVPPGCRWWINSYASKRSFPRKRIVSGNHRGPVPSALTAWTTSTRQAASGIKKQVGEDIFLPDVPPFTMGSASTFRLAWIFKIIHLRPMERLCRILPVPSRN